MDRLRRVGLATLVLLAISVPAGALGPPDFPRVEPVRVSIFNVSDFHGQLQPTQLPYGIGDRAPEQFGGAAYLHSTFEQRARAFGSTPFVVTAGDAVGATPPASGLFPALADKPTIEVMNMMGFDADTLGNHNFDRGEPHMAALAEGADFPYVAANVQRADGSQPSWLQRSTTWHADTVEIGVTGALNWDAPELLKPGSMGSLEVADFAGTVAALNAEAAALRARGIGTVVALVHVGATPLSAGKWGPAGPLLDLAEKLRGVDVLIGDHTNWAVNQIIADADNKPIRVIENYAKGVSFTQINLLLDPNSGKALSIDAQLVPASTRGVTPDARIQSYVDARTADIAEAMAEVVGHAREPVPQTLPVAESNQGNLATDALREATGADFALLNSGGFRSGFTRAGDVAEDGSYRIRRGYVLETLPFGNVASTVTVTGAQLKTILENGVSRNPYGDGRFPQVSGMKVWYTVTATPGSRVTRVERTDGTPVDLSSSSTYTLSMNDFIALGGDGYPSFKGKITYGDLLEDIVMDYLSARGPVTPEGPVPPATVPETRIFQTAS